MTKKIRLLIVDDSFIVRSALRLMLEVEGDIEVIGEGEDAFTAITLVEKLRPDIVTMDVQMPGKSGLEAVEQIMAQHPVPILVVTAEPLDDEAGVAFTAIENGALDIMAKPSFTDEKAGAEMRSLVRQLATTPVFQRATKARETVHAPGIGEPELLIVAAGTGGMPSVMGFLLRLPAAVACAVVVHQPMAPEKVRPYASHLAQIAHQPVKVATAGRTRCSPGEILLILGLQATFEKKNELTISVGEPDASTLLTSVAEHYGPNAVGVLLAGKGTDGVAGLTMMRKVAASTFTESPLSAVVKDLPLGALDADAVIAALPIPELANEVFELTNGPNLRIG